MTRVEWPPARLPAKFPLTPYKDGYCKHVNGKWRHVCGKLAPLAAKARYEERIRNGDFDARRVRVRLGPGLNVKGLANLYAKWLQQRLAGGHRLKLSVRTFADYRLAIQAFLDTRVRGLRVADVRVAELAPADFAAFMGSIPGKSPYTRSRFVAAIKAMFSWAEDEGHIERRPVYGSGFAKATRDELREARANVRKSFAAEELRTVLGYVGVDSVWWPMVLLALNGAFSNIELARLRREQVDLEQGVVQSMRGKRGRAYRKATLWPATIEALRRYRRPAPAQPEFDGLLFLTRNGLPYVRFPVERDADGNVAGAGRHDMISSGFNKILSEAGVAREGRGFAGFRTTLRTEAEGMAPPDHDAIDLICGHPRRHISSEYVERFPSHRIGAVTDFVFDQLFAGWSCPLTGTTPAPSPSSSASEP